MGKVLERPKVWPILSLLFVLLIVSACNISFEYPGFSKTSSGIKYKLNIIGESDLSPVPGNYITVDLRYSTIDDSVFFSARRKFQLEKPLYSGSVEECFAMMNAGDEAVFIINAHDFFKQTLGTSRPSFFNEHDPIKISVNMIDVQTEQAYIKEKEAFMSWIEDFNEYEKVRLQQYIRQEQLNVRPDSSGLYFIPVREGTGKRIEKGDTVDLHYEGRFLNGKSFDSTRKRNEVFQFVYGHEWQVTEGLEMAIGRMHEGEKALIILPSDMAFGEYVISSSIIPPYTSLIFEVEILSVK